MSVSHFSFGDGRRNMSFAAWPSLNGSRLSENQSLRSFVLAISSLLTLPVAEGVVRQVDRMDEA